MIDNTKKKQIIENNRINEHDTGSADVQIALLTDKIKSLNEHCQLHAKDNSSRRGLNNMVSKRRKLLSYLKTTDLTRYTQLANRIGLRA